MGGRLGDVAKVLRALAAFVVLGAVMGLLAAGLAIPAVGATGQAVNGGVKVFNDLPSELTQTPLNQQSRILDAKGGVIATPYAENRIIVPLKRIAPIMQKAQIAIEDSRFYEHGGLDVRGLSRALVSTLQGDKQGASTLTQQYVKLTLQENALHDDNQQAADAAVARTGLAGVSRKIQELKYAIALEQTLTKDQILEGYLNLAYYGDLAYGVEAASEHYFSTTAAKLDYNQAALLAGIVQLPGKTDPVNYPKASQARRDIVLDRMAQLGVITVKQARVAKAVPVAKMLKLKASQNTCQRSTQPYYCEYVMAWLKTQRSLGKDTAERLKNINTQGLTIQTALDPDLSAYTVKTLTAKVPFGDPSGVGAAATVIQPGTGKVLAMGQTSRFPVDKIKGTQVNWNVDTKYGGTIGFQFGSTAKLFALVTALSDGVPLSSSVFAKKAGPAKTAFATYTSADNNDGCGWVGPWNVHNDFQAGGTSIPLRVATEQSINTAFASLVLRLGVCRVQATEVKLGMHRGNGTTMLKYPAAVTLGADEVTPITLASAYATIAANGRYCTPVPVVSITDSARKAIKIDGPNCKQVIPSDIAAGVSSLLKGVLTDGTGRGNSLAGERPAAGKTGTTDEHVESWFVGYTPQLATAVYVGTPNSQRRMNRIKIGGAYYPQVFGATIAAPIWKKIMDYASTGLPAKDFPEPSGKLAHGEYISIPWIAGLSLDQATTVLEGAGFSAFLGGNSYSNIPAGLAVGTNPVGQAIKGSAVGILISTGYIPAPPPPPPPPPQPKPQPTPTPTTATTTVPVPTPTPTPTTPVPTPTKTKRH